MGLSTLNVKILECIRSKIRDPQEVSDLLNVDLGVIKENLNWLVYKKFITPEGKLTKKGFCKAPCCISEESIPKRKKL
jgi:predicted transcriptional regulator